MVSEAAIEYSSQWAAILSIAAKIGCRPETLPRWVRQQDRWSRKHDISASDLFNWRKLEREGALVAVQSGESVVQASELAAARAQLAQLQRMLGKINYETVSEQQTLCERRTKYQSIYRNHLKPASLLGLQGGQSALTLPQHTVRKEPKLL